MQPIFPPRLVEGDEVRVIAPARSMSIIGEETQTLANQRFEQIGLTLSFGKHIHESDDFTSTSIAARVEDIHDAFRDEKVKAIFTVIGGFNSNQLLDEIDWELIAHHPKILCGYSDITVLHNAIYARTGLVSYLGPHYSSFGDLKSFDYTLEYLQRCLFSDRAIEIKPSQAWSDDPWYLNQQDRTFIDNPGYLTIHQGQAQGTLLGGNLNTFNLLQGTQYFPQFEKDVILIIEDDAGTQPVLFDRDLQSLIQQPGFDRVRGIIIGRFQKQSNFTDELLIQIIQTKKALANLPIVAGVDFGHTTPMVTWPIGGKAQLIADQHASITLLHH